MYDNGRHREAVSTDFPKVINTMAAAIRAVKLYPPENPIFAQAVKKSFEALSRHLSGNPECRLAVRKGAFVGAHALVAPDEPAHRVIASDLYLTGVREIVFRRGLTETELASFYTVITTPQDVPFDCRGIESRIRERGLSHAAVRAASGGIKGKSDDSVTAAGTDGVETVHGNELEQQLKGKTLDCFGSTVTFSDMVADPSRLGRIVMERTEQAGGTVAERTDRIFEFYRDAGRRLLPMLPENGKQVFSSLAGSILVLDPAYRDRIITNKLYREFDRMTIAAQREHPQKQVPSDLHEILSSRFSGPWTTPQVSTLLMKSCAAGEPSPPADALTAHRHWYTMAREMSEFTPEEMESLKDIDRSGAEADTLDAAVRTLIAVLSLVRDPASTAAATTNTVFSRFSDTLSRLEEILSLLLDRKDYTGAARVLRSFLIPAAPLFRPRLAEAVKSAGGRKTIARLLDDIRALPRDSEEYQAVYSYLSLLDREATPVLLEMLAEEEDRPTRRLLTRILKDLGKNQIALLGEKLSDERWYFVRNIVNILGESRKEEVITYLEKVAGHKNFQIRQEVVRALVSIGGSGVADLLIRFLKDEDIDIQFMAIRGLGSLSTAAEKEERALIAFLRGRWMRKNCAELQKEAIDSLAMIGGAAASRFLKKFTTIKWWKARRPQETISAAARNAVQEIERRLGHA